jgi:glyoxylase-like metal-dependent hydrolase (beta-lactamase superfamily II)
VGDLAAHGIARLRAGNPSAYTLDGTNTWVIGRDPAWVVDPGPALDDHLDAVAAEVAARGGAGGIALTHDHDDHAEGLAALLERLGRAVPVAAARHPADVALADGGEFGPLRALAIPGHADDHLAFVAGGAAFTGDAVLGQGSVFVTGRLREYLDALERLRALHLDVLCPGHGPPVEDPDAKLGEYIDHRQDRERRLLEALEAGLRTRDELLDAAWSDAPPALRQAAAVTLDAHLGKLRDEGRLPVGFDD